MPIAHVSRVVARALKESHEWLTKSRDAQKGPKAQSLALRISHVENFVSARKMVKTDPETTVKMCFELLEQPEVEVALRVGCEQGASHTHSAPRALATACVSAPHGGVHLARVLQVCSSLERLRFSVSCFISWQ